MHFIKIFIHIVIVSILVRKRMCLAYSEMEDDMPMELERLLDELTSLKNKLDEWFNRNKNNNRTECASGTTDEYFQNVANFLIGNQTSCEENCINKLSGFFRKIKEKIQKVVNIITRKNASRSTNFTDSCAHIRRSILGPLKLPKNKAKFNQEAENFHQYLTKVINCLETNKKRMESASGENASGFKFITTHNLAIIHADEDDNFNLNAPMRYETTSPETSDEEEIPSASKIQNILKFLADSHHSVEETGRAGFKPPDLKKIQEIIDSAKSSMINLNFDDETTSSTTIDPFDFRVFRKRNIFNDFVKKFESKSRKFDGETKTNAKIKENELFDGTPKIDEDFREMGGIDDYLEREEHQKPIIDEGRKTLDQDLITISSKLDAKQRMVDYGLRNEKF